MMGDQRRTVLSSCLLFLLLCDILASCFSASKSGGKDESEFVSTHSDYPAVLFVASFCDVILYANGERQRPDHWLHGDTNTLRLRRHDAYLIGVHLRTRSDGGGRQERAGDAPLGFLASLEQHTATPSYSHTDESWRCVTARRGSQPGSQQLNDGKRLKWYARQYDDSAWPSAIPLGKNGDSPWHAMMEVSSKAKWIWTKSEERSDDVYCRGWLSHHPDTLWITADSAFKLFANGRHLGNGANFRRTFEFSLPGLKSHLIAVHAQAKPTKAGPTTDQPGIIASLQAPAAPTGVSGATWRCVKKLRAEERKDNAWTRVGFNDRSWPDAITVGEHGESPWGTLLDISQHADWVWAKGRKSTPQEAYCRAWMSSSMYGGDTKASEKPSSNASELAMLRLYPIIKTIPEIEARDLNTTYFFQQHLSAGRPVKIKGATDDWLAKTRWQDDGYLDEKIGKDNTYITTAPLDSNTFYFYSQHRKFVQSTVGYFLENYRRPDRTENMYLAQHPLMSEETERHPRWEEGTNSPLKNDIIRPPWSNIMKLEDAFMWMGAGQQVTPVHFDNSENIMTMVVGRKRVRLYEPYMSNFLYPVLHTRNIAITSQIANLSSPDLEKFPEARHLEAVVVELEPGDALFIPSYWWHEVTSLDRNIAVNWWFNHHSSVLDGIYSKWSHTLPQTKWGHEQERQTMMEKNQAEAEAHRQRDEL